MARPLRFLPPGAMAEVTLRTVHGRLLLRPGRMVNTLVVGVLGRAQRKYGMKIHALAAPPKWLAVCHFSASGTSSERKGAVDSSAAEVYGPVGVLDLSLYRKRCRAAHASS